MSNFQFYLESANPSLIIERVKEYMRGVEQNNPYHKYDLLGHTEKVVEFLQKHGADQDLILAGWLHDVGKKEAAKPKIDDDGNTVMLNGKPHMQFLGHADKGVEWINQNFPAVSQRVKDMVKQHDRVGDLKKEGKLVKILKMHDQKWVDDLMLLREADIRAHKEDDLPEMLQDLEQQKEKFKRLAEKYK